MWSGAEENTAAPPRLHPISATFGSSILPSSSPCPGVPVSHPFRRPAAGRVPLSRPRGTLRWGGSSSLRERESKAKGTNANPSQLQAVGSCPGRTHGAGCGRRSSCHHTRCPWKALVPEGVKESDFAACSFPSPGIFSSPSLLVSPDLAVLWSGGWVGSSWLW